MIVSTVLIVVILCGIYALKSRYNYWKKKNVPYLTPLPILGNYADHLLFKKNFGETAQKLCKNFPNEPYFGTFFGTEPALMIQDPNTIRTVISKDFYYFNSREVDKYTDREPITKSMFFIGGDPWKVMRQNLTPIFTSAKMKKTFPLIENCCYEFERLLNKEVAMSNRVEAKFLMARFTMGCIGSTSFGVNTNTMEGLDDNNIFLMVARDALADTYTMATKFIIRSIWPAIFYGAKMQLFSKEIFDYFDNLLKDVFKSRNYKPANRNDFIDLILDFRKEKYITGDSITNLKTGENKKAKVEVDDEYLVIMCLMMFIAGFETSATTSSFTLFNLAKNQKAQKQVQKEVDDFLNKHNNEITYDCLTELPYLDACLDETLRLYPVLGVLTREVVEDYTLSTDKRNSLRLEKGMRIHIPLHHLHRNPDHFPEPEEYKPERFFGDNKKNIKPYTYMPFGEGPRLCLGMRFAKMQMIAGMITVLKKYHVELAEGMPETPKLEPKSFGIKSVGGVNLKFSHREGWENRVFIAKS